MPMSCRLDVESGIFDLVLPPPLSLRQNSCISPPPMPATHRIFKDGGRGRRACALTYGMHQPSFCMLQTLLTAPSGLLLSSSVHVDVDFQWSVKSLLRP